METDKRKFQPVNWNAGTEFNEIIKIIKENYIISELSQDYDAALSTLSTDFDFSYAKILSESIKLNKQKKVKKLSKKIRLYIDNARNFCNTKKNYPNYGHIMMNKLNYIKRLVWDLQGEFGILYPYQEEKNNDPSDAVKRGYS